MPRTRGTPPFGGGSLSPRRFQAPRPAMAPEAGAAHRLVAAARSGSADGIDHELALKLQARLNHLSMRELQRLSVTNPELLREWTSELRDELDRTLGEANRLSIAIDRLLLAGRIGIERAAE
ncbi:MAG: hypothetical protein AB1749_17365 [Pseudomonadota bacterium]